MTWASLAFVSVMDMSRTAACLTRSLPNCREGSYFENLAGRSERVEASAALFLTPRHRAGQHDIKLGADTDHLGYDEDVVRAPVNYLREDGTLLRQSTFPVIPSFPVHNIEVGGYIQDRWQPRKGLLVEPGLCASIGTRSFAARSCRRALPPFTRRPAVKPQPSFPPASASTTNTRSLNI